MIILKTGYKNQAVPDSFADADTEIIHDVRLLISFDGRIPFV